MDEACKILGITRSSLYWKRKKLGLDIANLHNEKIISREQLILAIKSSRTMQEAADKLGVERTVLFDKRKKLGLTSEVLNSP